MIEPSMQEGTVAVADEQIAGRGRLGRKWETPAGKAIHCSVLLKPPPRRHVPELSLVAGIAVADTVERTTGLAAQIKWPNDVMLRRSKVAGCLAELHDGAVTLGIGINVNQTREELPPVTGSPPGSLFVATGQEWPRAPLLAMLLTDLEHCYSGWLSGGLDSLYPSLGSRDFLRGRHVSVNGTSGTAVKIDRAGRLEIAVGQGEVTTVESGEVRYER
jgi:BirA family transcriptional regulator, biotin operon repressor / biotin---[acetyl-CoA-carboxylase] ligase